MKYYEVTVAHSYGDKDQGKLTYHSDEQLVPGSLVVVPHGKRKIVGIVWRELKAKPAFATKEVGRTLSLPPISPLRLGWLEWVSEYYASGLSSTVSAFLPAGLGALKEIDPLGDKDSTLPRPSALPALTEDQLRVLQAVGKARDSTHWLHAETGAGKTRIYLELARQMLNEGKNVLVLVPEIALSAQTHDQLTGAYGDAAVLFHSQLPMSQRRQIWAQALLNKQPRLWIGTRSALFLPINDLGLVVVDECHDSSYSQEQAPRYQATHIAAKLAQLHNAKLMLSSATPPLADIYFAEQKNLPIHRIKDPVSKAKEVKRELIDLRNPGNRSRVSAWISRQLEQALEDTLQRNEQAILFLNRRGSAPLVLCANCGWQAKCPNCHMPMTYHGDKHELLCHTCGKHESMIGSCPSCREPDLLLKGCGTKEIESAIKRRFPKAKLLRVDSDNVQASEIAQLYQIMKNGEVDIIIGTQMIAKGFDLPGVSLIGIVHADAGISMPDFASAERTFQLIYQAVGRSGRHSEHNHIIVQTYRPNHPIIQSAINHDWDSFYRAELEERRANNFPPLRFALKVTARKESEAAAAKILGSIAKKAPPGLISLGPAPALHARSGKSHIWNMIFLSPTRKALADIVLKLPAGTHGELDPANWL